MLGFLFLVYLLFIGCAVKMSGGFLLDMGGV